MALECAEHTNDDFLRIDNPVYGVVNPATVSEVNPSGDLFTVCQKAIENIPVGERNYAGREQQGDIEIRVCAPQPNGPVYDGAAYARSGLQVGPVLFTVSRSTLIEQLPAVAANVLQ